jgi:hypothetical protein
MMKSKVKQLALAVGVALGGMSLLPSAEAVSVSSDNLGQVLIFPYYTVRSGWNTLLGVTNTSDRVVAVKVRFREAENSRDVFDFDVILSPYDIWTATLSDSATGPVIYSDDKSCTVGTIGTTPVPFTTTAYTQPSAVDGGGTTPDRMRDGYVEMIMMGASAATPNSLAAYAIHGTNGVPANCPGLVAAFQNANGIAAVQAAFPEMIPSPLKGTFSLVNQEPGKGFNAVGLPTALNNFRYLPYVTLMLPPEALGGSVTNSGYEPTLAATQTPGIYYDAGNDLPVIDPAATNGAAAVTHALVQASVLNEWSRRPQTADVGWATITDWVVTLPTKMFYVDNNTSVYGGRAAGRTGLPTGLPPFSEYFNGKSCDEVSITVYNREEQSPPPSTIVYPPFSPWTPPPSYTPPELCYEANVLTFNKGALLGADRSLSIQGYPDSYLFGWMQIDFITYPLPAIGFAITSRDSNDPGSLLSEAALYDHSYIRPVRSVNAAP